ncbi:MAG: hypothetical protein O7C56_09980, partial [Rickettsia endosymbiont of Ixodes persulcatus]|nr:hypothetical protein [Rickettsia endosymbiont of Ixodes persulcatus]
MLKKTTNIVEIVPRIFEKHIFFREDIEFKTLFLSAVAKLKISTGNNEKVTSGEGTLQVERAVLKNGLCRAFVWCCCAGAGASL